MENQIVKGAFLALLFGAGAGCAGPAKAPTATAHLQSPVTPTAFTRVDVARNYEFVRPEPVAASASADPSYAAAHEQDTGFANDHTKPLKGLFTSASVALPAGWSHMQGDAVRHDASGLECAGQITLANEKRIFTLRQLKSFDDRNMDVACDYATGSGHYLTFYASFWPRMSLEESYSGAVAAIRQRFDVQSTVAVPLAKMKSNEPDPVYEGLEQQMAAGFNIGPVDGVPYRTSLWLAKTHGWHVKTRATYPVDDPMTELVAAITFSFAHVKVRTKNMTDPIGQSGEV